ncbi:hypothetical protein ACFZA9_12010 [Streptomyces olivaceus]|uniref:hypothetical protein n=1 Tax=Streptomyces olivaceus TaxID=47716 RepID=UPI0036E71A50
MDRIHQPHPQPSPRTAAAIVAAGTAITLAPIDPQASRPAETPAPATVPGFTAILLADAALRDQAVTAAKVAKHLGYSPYWTPRPHLGETPTRVNAWDQHELNALYERVGGTVTTREITALGTLEITLTVQVSDVGPVQIVTDFDEESGGRDLPVMRAARAAAVEPLGDLVSGDALHTNPAAHRVRSWMTVDVAERLTAGADQRATAVTA